MENKDTKSKLDKLKRNFRGIYKTIQKEIIIVYFHQRGEVR